MRKTPYVLAAVQGSMMILNCLDCSPEKEQDGPGSEMLRDGFRNPEILALIIKIADARRISHGPGVVLVDGGAHIGSFTVPWARHMRSWGSVLAFEPQRWVYMALCGNVVINNCFNVDTYRAALGERVGIVNIPRLDPGVPENSGGVQVGTGEDKVSLMAIDDLGLDRCDIIKLDLEGMEPQALKGAARTIQRHKPIILAEHFICGVDTILGVMPGYDCIGIGGDLLCVHQDDPNRQLLSDMENLARNLNYSMVRCSGSRS